LVQPSPDQQQSKNHPHNFKQSPYTIVSWADPDVRARGPKLRSNVASINHRTTICGIERAT